MRRWKRLCATSGTSDTADFLARLSQARTNGRRLAPAYWGLSSFVLVDLLLLLVDCAQVARNNIFVCIPVRVTFVCVDIFVTL